jgi:hypothetical protein
MNIATLDGEFEYEKLVASCFSTAISNRTYPGYVTVDRIYPSRLPTAARSEAERRVPIQVWVGPTAPVPHREETFWLDTDIRSDTYNVFLVTFEPSTATPVWRPLFDAYFLVNPKALLADLSAGTSPVFTGATSTTAGSAGLVPPPSAGDESKVLSGAGAWVDNSNAPIRWDPPPFPSGVTLFTLPSLPNPSFPVLLHVNGQVMNEGDGFTRSGVNITWTNHYSLEPTDRVYFHYVES